MIKFQTLLYFATLLSIGAAYRILEEGNKVVEENNIDIEREVTEEEDPLEFNIEHGHGNFQGDLMLSKSELEMMNGEGQDRSLKVANWPRTGSFVNIPYTLDRNNNWSASELDNLEKAMDEYKAKTCIRFAPRTTEKDFIFILHKHPDPNSRGCWSKLGMQGGVQELSLYTGCLTGVGTAIHEFMHAIGYLHEQSRKDRDQYVKINYDNIEAGKEKQFSKCEDCDLQGLPYDVGSVMHYHATAFSKNDEPTIEVLNGNAEIGQRNGFSALDVEGINKIYCECSKNKPCSAGKICNNGVCSADCKDTLPSAYTCPWGCEQWAANGYCQNDWSNGDIAMYCNTGNLIEKVEDTCKLSCGKCVVNGGWGEWSEWEECPVTCEGGDQRRTRVCDNPEPAFGGTKCNADGSTASETQRCNEDPCPVDGGWGEWSEWDECPVTCGGADQGRNRVCDNPEPDFGGAHCDVDGSTASETQRCNENSCPVSEEVCIDIKVVTKSYGYENSWTFGKCSSASRYGNYKTTTEQCCQPAGDYELVCKCSYGDGWHKGYLEIGDEKYCETFLSGREKKETASMAVVVNGGWGEWSEWGDCPVTCGGGAKRRTRVCDNPAPALGGDDCNVDGSNASETQRCNEDPCPSTCTSGQFTCRNGDCISQFYNNDGWCDCLDCSDESWIG